MWKWMESIKGKKLCYKTKNGGKNGFPSIVFTLFIIIVFLYPQFPQLKPNSK